MTSANTLVTFCFGSKHGVCKRAQRESSARSNAADAAGQARCQSHTVRVTQRERLVLADRTHHYNAPLGLMFDALTTDRAWWLGLQPGEIEPKVLEAVRPERVVWSSFWPASPHDTIEFDLSGTGSVERQVVARKVVDLEPTAIRFRWFSDSPPDARGIGITRQRLYRKLGGNLRAVVSEYFWTGGGRSHPRPDVGSP